MALGVVAVGGVLDEGADGLCLVGGAPVAVVVEAEGAAAVGEAAQPADAVGAGVPGVGDGLVVIGHLGDTVLAVVAVGGGLPPCICPGLEVSGFVVSALGDTGVGAGEAEQVAQAVHLVVGFQVARVGDLGDLA